AVAALAALLGTVQLLRRRRVALTGWRVLMLAAWLALAASATTWGKAKEEMLTSPVVVLLSWAGIAALLGSPPRPAASPPPAVYRLLWRVATTKPGDGPRARPARAHTSCRRTPRDRPAARR